MNFVTGIVTKVYEMKNKLNKQPQYFKVNDDQRIFIVSSAMDGVYVNTNLNQEVDLDDTYIISNIMEIIFDHDDDVFYILTNKYEEKLGFFVLRIQESNPFNGSFLIKWKNKLDIGDTNIFVLRNHEKGIKEIIISYKTIYINTFNVVVMDISKDNKKNMIFRHESF